MLPRTVFVIPLQVEPGTRDVTVSFPGVRARADVARGLVAPAEGEATYYFHMQRWNRGPHDWPPPAMRAEKATPRSTPAPPPPPPQAAADGQVP